MFNELVENIFTNILSEAGSSKTTVLPKKEKEIPQYNGKDIETGVKIISLTEDKIKKILEKNNIVVSNMNFLGQGSYGMAFDIGGNKVLKLTSDPSEADAMSILKNHPHSNIAKIYDSLNIDTNKYNLFFPHGVDKEKRSRPILAFIILEKLLPRKQTPAAMDNLIFYFKEIIDEFDIIQTNNFKIKAENWNKNHKAIAYISMGNIIKFEPEFKLWWNSTSNFRKQNKNINDLFNSLQEEFKRGYIDFFQFNIFDGYFEAIIYINKYVKFTDIHSGNMLLTLDRKTFKFIDLGDSKSKEKPIRKFLKIEQIEKIVREITKKKVNEILSSGEENFMYRGYSGRPLERYRKDNLEDFVSEYAKQIITK